MTKIPVKIIEFSDGDKKIQEVMIDLVDTMQIDGDPGKKIEQFRDKYFNLVKQAEKLFYGNDLNEKKKYQNLPSSTYWKLGKILQKFNEDIKNEFKVTNYNQSISRDFGLSVDYVYDLVTIVKIFKKNEILDSVPFSYYRALKRKKNELEKLGLFEKEKKRLNQLGEKKKLPGRENYKKELNTIVATGKSYITNR